MIHSVVVGGTRGVGREVTRSFAAAGHFVQTLGRRLPPDPESGVEYLAVEITDRAAREATLARVIAAGAVNNIVFTQRFRSEGNNWAGEIDTTLSATRAIIDSLTPHFAAGNGASIVLTSSVAGTLVADEQSVGYHVAKAGTLQLARYYAVRLGPRGVRVNSVSPAVFIKTESEAFYQAQPALTQLLERITPLGRVGHAREIASVIHFLCSSAASFVSGQNIVVDGGMSLRAPARLALISTDISPTTPPATKG